MNTPSDSVSSRKLLREQAVSALVTACSKSMSVVQYEVTNACQNRCAFCYNFDRSDASPVDPVTIVSALLSQGIRVVSFTGGEPLLARRVFDAARAVKAAGTAVLITNGRLIPEIEARDLLDSFDMFQVALQSPDEDVHDFLCGSRGAFRDTTRGIESLVRLGATVGVCTTLTKQNLASLSEMPGFLREIGVRFWYVNRMCPPPSGRSGDGLNVDPVPLRSALEELAFASAAKAMVFGILSGVPSRLALGSQILKAASRRCGMGFGSGLTVRPDGSISPCPPLNIRIGHFLNLGEAYRAKTQVYTSLRSQVRGLCRVCARFEECGGGCRAAAYNFSGRWDGPDPFCAQMIVERGQGDW